MAARGLLSAPVGKGRRAANRPADVRTVQHLFNILDDRARLPENGRSDPALVNRIDRFQREVLRYPHPDGRVDPEGKTLRMLLARAGEKMRAKRPAPPTDADESWTSWAQGKLADLQRAMAGAWSSLFADHSRERRVSAPSPAGRTAGKGAAPASPAPAGGSGGAARKLTDRDYVDAAARLGRDIDPLLVRALATVESGGRSGFGPDGLPKIAFEGHWFRKLTKNKYDETHPLLSYPYKTKAGWQWQKNNKDHATAWRTLREAMALDANAALQSTSWGMCQVLGANYWKCGYKDVFAFVEAMKAGERGQLEAFVGYCLKTPGMVSALRRKDFAGMARAYNGDDYGTYDKQFATEYKKLGGKV